MRRRRTRTPGDIDSPTIYSSDEYTQLTEIIGTEDWAHNRDQLATNEITRLCDRIAVDDDVAATATRIYRQIIGTNLVNNYSIGLLTAAAVYTACREHREPRTLADIDDAAYVRIENDDETTRMRTYDGSRRSVRQLQIVYREIRDRFDRRNSPVEAEKFARRYCDELGLGEQVEEFVRVAITRVDGEAVAGRDPNSTAAGAIYYASEKLGLGLTQREIGAVTHCTVPTIGEMRTVIKESIEP